MKDAFWFSHDSNANSDPKCIMLIEQLGLEGYGIFWVLIETLRDQPGYRYPLALVPALARRFNTTAEKMNVVIRNYNLFQISEDSFFFSESLFRRMERHDHQREVARLAGQASAQKRLSLVDKSTDVQRTFNECSTIIEHNITKQDIKKDKSKKIFKPPTIEEVTAYCLERKNTVNPQQWIDHYIANGWKVGRNPMRDWKAAVRTWERNNYGGNNGINRPDTSKINGQSSESERFNSRKLPNSS